MQTFAQTWSLTPQSQIGFEIKSFGLTVVKAQFEGFQATLHYDVEQPTRAAVQFQMPVAQLKTSQARIKKLILSEDLFYAEKFKTAQFKSTRFKAIGLHQYEILGDLTLRGVTRPVRFYARLKPVINYADRLDVTATAEINRYDFGMNKQIAGIGDKVYLQVMGQWQRANEVSPK